MSERESHFELQHFQDNMRKILDKNQANGDAMNVVNVGELTQADMELWNDFRTELEDLLTDSKLIETVEQHKTKIDELENKYFETRAMFANKPIELKSRGSFIAWFGNLLGAMSANVSFISEQGKNIPKEVESIMSEFEMMEVSTK